MSSEIWNVFILSMADGGYADVSAFMFYHYSLSVSPSLYLFNYSISSALPPRFISASFSAGRVSFLGVTMATMGSLYPFQSPHRFTTTSAWSKTSSSQVKRALHGEWKHILILPNIPSWNCFNEEFFLKSLWKISIKKYFRIQSRRKSGRHCCTLLNWPCTTGSWTGINHQVE